MHVAGLTVHPVKGLRGEVRTVADVERAGLRGDRRWMVVDGDGRTLRADRVPAMLSVRASAVGDGVLLTDATGARLEVAAPHGGDRVDVALARVGTAVLADGTAHDWLSARLGRPVRLVWLEDLARRTVDAGRGGLPGDVLSLADAGPLLLTSAASLRVLDRWVAAGQAERHAACPRDAGSRPAHVAMERFRPNVVVDGPPERLSPFAEDGWTHVRLGEVTFRVSEPCDRSAVPGLDPETGRMTPEPLRALARHRRRDGRTLFGVRLVPLTTGRLRVGDPVVALDVDLAPVTAAAPVG